MQQLDSFSRALAALQDANLKRAHRRCATLIPQERFERLIIRADRGLLGGLDEVLIGLASTMAASGEDLDAKRDACSLPELENFGYVLAVLEREVAALYDARPLPATRKALYDAKVQVARFRERFDAHVQRIRLRQELRQTA
jgi:hypothetical protein